jgi:DNA-binding transcriptional MerR regulator
LYSIGQLSRRTGVKVPTIRYYEGLGLIASQGRTSGNQRRYDQTGLDRLAFIRHARDLGLPLGAIRELIALDPASHAETHRIAAMHLADVRHRIARLGQLEAELGRIVHSCDGGPGDACNILAALGDHDQCEGVH